MNINHRQFVFELQQLVLKYGVTCLRAFNHDEHSINNVLEFQDGSQLIFPREITADQFVNHNSDINPDRSWRDIKLTIYK